MSAGRLLKGHLKLTVAPTLLLVRRVCAIVVADGSSWSEPLLARRSSLREECGAQRSFVQFHLVEDSEEYLVGALFTAMRYKSDSVDWRTLTDALLENSAPAVK